MGLADLPTARPALGECRNTAVIRPPNTAVFRYLITAVFRALASPAVVAGPDEPVDGRSPAEAEVEHLAHLESAALRQGTSVSASELEHLPHDIEFGNRLLLHLNTG